MKLTIEINQICLPFLESLDYRNSDRRKKTNCYSMKKSWKSFEGSIETLMNWIKTVKNQENVSGPGIESKLGALFAKLSLSKI